MSLIFLQLDDTRLFSTVPVEDTSLPSKHKITELYPEWFSVSSNITRKFRSIAMFKGFVKQNNDSNKACMYVHCLLLCPSATAHELSP
jgi:hypothetical protein